MEFRLINRAPGTSQQSVTADDIQHVFRRVFGVGTRVESAVELGAGMYNNVYRVVLAGRPHPVVLRVAPEEDRQFRSERRLMRNELASLPWLAPIAHLMPQVIAADWTGQVVARDWMVQTHLEGVPAPEHLGSYPRSAWRGFFQQMGAITRTVHAVQGPHFGPVAGPGYFTWSEAVIASLEDIAADLDGVGLDSTDVRKVAAVADHDQAVLDEITEPQLLTGDLWTVNTMVDRNAAAPTITGVLDFDRCTFGDVQADWTIRMAKAKKDERTAFWESYGPLDRSAAAVWRALIYEAKHLGAIRLERHRLGKADAVSESYGAMADLLAELT
ncbi:phosphotransferase family protein [Streptomyces sp. NPDC048638]|uniref:phosphotransferase family protein n=1 Tax=Streptomyces sp. NPDC048638 TaxID=3365580 RepID=UPI00371C4754